MTNLNEYTEDDQTKGNGDEYPEHRFSYRGLWRLAFGVWRFSAAAATDAGARFIGGRHVHHSSTSKITYVCCEDVSDQKQPTACLQIRDYFYHCSNQRRTATSNHHQTLQIGNACNHARRLLQTVLIVRKNAECGVASKS